MFLPKTAKVVFYLWGAGKSEVPVPLPLLLIFLSHYFPLLLHNLLSCFFAPLARHLNSSPRQLLSTYPSLSKMTHKPAVTQQYLGDENVSQTYADQMARTASSCKFNRLSETPTDFVEVLLTDEYSKEQDEIAAQPVPPKKQLESYLIPEDQKNCSPEATEVCYPPDTLLQCAEVPQYLRENDTKSVCKCNGLVLDKADKCRTLTPRVRSILPSPSRMLIHSVKERLVSITSPLRPIRMHAHGVTDRP